ncbi:cation efflux protein [Basidiobolus meristosporus CBS 931.73]|uniref:Cation efflux protein n=1 Tax=Basidiobolus meristosporus CBS 931.73 TaxID=1314790 RepID=A0A1Y1YCL5_9FUNG|nr:cation efflux protein [Basidiobolus meristosporus CBS 931.73]|eukprot:ORX95675.1 cation efflux protein [Basidiobolus meristosporus CBS 931.73]
MALKRTTRLLILLCLTTIFFFAEIIVGYLVGSIALVADSFHMLSDLLSILVALYAIKLSKKKTYESHYTYGWQRAEVIGALINGVFLIALCFSIFIEAIQRFFEPQEIKDPVLILIVGGLGLFVNIVGLFLFHEHSHAGHSHGTPSHQDIESPNSYGTAALSHQSIIQTAEEFARSQHSLSDGYTTEDITMKKAGEYEAPEPKQKSGRLNMHGVFLHVLGDALGSIAVIITSLIIWLGSFPQRFLFDPIISILITCLILFFTIPLVRSAAYILLQGVPRSIPVDELRSKILKIPNVVSLHELHIWQLSDNKAIASVHIHVTNASDYMTVATEVKRVLHSYGVHSATIQPEFPSDNSTTESLPIKEEASEMTCLLRCSSECDEQKCCITSSAPLINLDDIDETGESQSEANRHL